MTRSSVCQKELGTKTSRSLKRRLASACLTGNNETYGMVVWLNKSDVENFKKLSCTRRDENHRERIGERALGNQSHCRDLRLCMDIPQRNNSRLIMFPVQDNTMFFPSNIYSEPLHKRVASLKPTTEVSMSTRSKNATAQFTNQNLINLLSLGDECNLKQASKSSKIPDSIEKKFQDSFENKSVLISINHHQSDVTFYSRLKHIDIGSKCKKRRKKNKNKRISKKTHSKSLKVKIEGLRLLMNNNTLPISNEKLEDSTGYLSGNSTRNTSSTDELMLTNELIKGLREVSNILNFRRNNTDLKKATNDKNETVSRSGHTTITSRESMIKPSSYKQPSINLVSQRFQRMNISSNHNNISSSKEKRRRPRHRTHGQTSSVQSSCLSSNRSLSTNDASCNDFLEKEIDSFFAEHDSSFGRYTTSSHNDEVLYPELRSKSDGIIPSIPEVVEEGVQSYRLKNKITKETDQSSPGRSSTRSKSTCDTNQTDFLEKEIDLFFSEHENTFGCYANPKSILKQQQRKDDSINKRKKKNKKVRFDHDRKTAPLVVDQGNRRRSKESKKITTSNSDCDHLQVNHTIISSMITPKRDNDNSEKKTSVKIDVATSKDRLLPSRVNPKKTIQQSVEDSTNNKASFNSLNVQGPSLSSNEQQKNQHDISAPTHLEDTEREKIPAVSSNATTATATAMTTTKTTTTGIAHEQTNTTITTTETHTSRTRDIISIFEKNSNINKKNSRGGTNGSDDTGGDSVLLKPKEIISMFETNARDPLKLLWSRQGKSVNPLSRRNIKKI